MYIHLDTHPQSRDRLFITCLPFQVVFWHLLHLTLKHISSSKQNCFATTHSKCMSCNYRLVARPAGQVLLSNLSRHDLKTQLYFCYLIGHVNRRTKIAKDTARLGLIFPIYNFKSTIRTPESIHSNLYFFIARRASLGTRLQFPVRQLFAVQSGDHFQSWDNY